MAIFVQEIMNAFLKGNTWIFFTSEEQILCNFYVMFLEFSEKTALKISTICQVQPTTSTAVLFLLGFK